MRLGAPPASLSKIRRRPMNTINSTNGQIMAMDGHALNSISDISSGRKVFMFPNEGALPNGAAEVSENLSKSHKGSGASIEEIQRVSEEVMGHTLKFNVNSDSGKVVVKVINPNSGEVIREIPTEEIQKLQAHLKMQQGLLFDETI